MGGDAGWGGGSLMVKQDRLKPGWCQVARWLGGLVARWLGAGGGNLGTFYQTHTQGDQIIFFMTSENENCARSDLVFVRWGPFLLDLPASHD